MKASKIEIRQVDGEKESSQKSLWTVTNLRE